jgi:hypothetical protein
MRRVELGSYATRKTDLDLHTRANKFVSKRLFPVARTGMLSTPGRRLCDQEVSDRARMKDAPWAAVATSKLGPESFNELPNFAVCKTR